MSKRKKIIIIVFFIVAQAISFLVISFCYNKMSNNYLNKNTIKLEANYYAIQESFLLMCDLFFNQTIKKEKLLKLYSNAQFADDRRKKEIRDSLYEMLITDFEYLKTINVRQLHFYLPDNTSFLRFNKPQKYGDNLTDIRYSVKMTNKNLKKHSGFEEGCVFNGLRNVYPLLYNNEHIGSVEISLSFDAIKKQLLQNDSCSVGFMIRKDVLEKKVFISEKNNYIASLLSEDFLHEKEFLHYNNEEGLKVIDEKIKNKIKASLSENKSFTVYQRINDKYYLISFVSIKNIEKKAVAYIFSYKETNYISKIKRERIMLHILAFLVIALFVYLLVKIDSKREVIKKQNRSLKESKNELQQTIIHLKKANENTEESEQKFRDLSNLLPVIIYEVDLEGNFMFLNKQSFKSFGYDKKIFEDKINVLQMVIAKDRDKAKQKMYEILSQGTISSTEYTALRKDGSTFPALVYSGAIVRNNKTIGIRGAMIDISELKNTEHKLIEAKKEIEKSEQKFRDLFEKSGDAMLIIENGVFVDCNQSAIDLLEYKAKEDIINLRPKEISPEKQPNGEKSRTEEIKMIDLALKNGTHRFEWIHKKKNGKLFPVEIVLTAIKNEFNKTTIHASVRDISIQKNAEQRLTLNNIELIDSEANLIAANRELQTITNALENNNKKLRTEKERVEKIKQQFTALFEQIPISVQIFNKEGIAINANKAWSKLWKTPLSEMINKYNILEDKYGEEIGTLKYLKEAFKGKVIHIPELEYDPKKSGRYGNNLILKTIAFPVIIKGEIENVVVIHQDITDIKKYENELVDAKKIAQESNQLKTEFIHNMSHEIRTPMNGILGFSEFLDDPDLTEDEKKHYISIIQNSGKQLMRVIDDILEISKLGTKQVKTFEKQICLNNLFLELFSVFDLKAKENKTPLYFKKGLSDKDSYIYSDETKLNKILSNLLENALKFTNEGFIEFGYTIVVNEIHELSLQNEFHLQTDPIHESYLRLYVKDTGIGIKEESQNTIFERFSQEEKELSKNVGGLGLGLSIAKENAELLGGKITLESEKGKGTTFFVTIPYKPVFTEETTVDETKNKSNYTVLIAEDDEINFLYIETLIENFEKNIKIIHAKNGQEAVNHSEKYDIDLVLMDLKMPVMNGFDATKKIKGFKPDLTIIAQTAYSVSDEKEKAFSAGCEDFITKPINKEFLSSIIDKYLTD